VRRNLGVAKRSRARKADGTRALEELVRTVAVLDGRRAEALLSGLGEAVLPSALGLLRRLERCSRAERHARLASAFSQRPSLLAAADGIPGRLGVEVREALALGATPEPAGDDSPTGRWARRLLLELAGE
jgi:hypothetical protein